MAILIEKKFYFGRIKIYYVFMDGASGDSPADTRAAGSIPAG